MNTESGLPRRPGEIRHTPSHGIPRATPPEGTPVQPAGVPIPPGAPTSPIVHAPPAPQAPVGQGASPQPTGPQPLGGPAPEAPLPRRRAPGEYAPPAQPPPAAQPLAAELSGGQPLGGQLPGAQPPAAQSPGGQPAGGQLSGAQPLGAQASGVQGPGEYGPGVGGDGPPRVWGTPPVSEPGPQVGGAEWSAVPEAQDAYTEQEERSSTTGPMGVRETSGVQVRLGSRERERERQAARRRAGRRSGLVAAGVLVLAGLVTIGLVLTPGSGDDGGADAPPAGGVRPQAAADLPPAGSPITVGTADGSKYRIAAVTSGVSDGVVTTFQSPPSGTSFPYVEYILSNPTDEKVLLDFPGDVFVKRSLVTPDAQGRCMPQAGVPEEMCTPPTKSEVVRRLAGGALVPGDGGDKYIPPGAAYLVRATVDVPVDRNVKRSDLGLYVWKQLYMADQLAKQAPFPNGK